MDAIPFATVMGKDKKVKRPMRKRKEGAPPKKAQRKEARKEAAEKEGRTSPPSCPPRNDQNWSIPTDTDYSRLEDFRGLLNKFHCNGQLSCPPLILELSTVFLRCLNTVQKSRSTLEKKKGFQQANRQFHLQLIAALSWIYAHGHQPSLPSNKAPIQSLAGLRDAGLVHAFRESMELAQLLVTCAWKTLKITLDEVAEARIGSWFNNRIAQAKKDVWSIGGAKDRLQNGGQTVGIYFPFYLVLLSIHPNCPGLLTDNAVVNITQGELCSVLLEPRLYMKESLEEEEFEAKVFPKSLDGTNYNLWFFYDHLQPVPFKSK